MTIVELLIENFALFKRAELAFDAGLNVLSGESGAGKSLVLESLAILFGARLGSDRVGRFGDRMRIRAALEIALDDSRWKTFEELGVEPDAIMVIERTAERDGRSLYRVQGRLVPAQTVRAFGEAVLQYVGQHQVLKAADPAEVLHWVDRFGRLDKPYARFLEAYRGWQEEAQKLAKIEAAAQDLDRLDEKRALLEEIEALNIQSDEDQRIQEELARLRAGRKLMETSQSLYTLLDGGSGGESLIASMSEVRRLAEVLRNYDTGLTSMVDLVLSAERALSEVRLDLARWMDTLDLDPDRLDVLEQRADELSRIKRRFGPELRDVLDNVRALKEDLGQLDNLDWERQQQKKRTEKAEASMQEAAEALSSARQSVLDQAQEALRTVIREMEMPTGELEFRVERQSASVRGIDHIEIWFSANQGQPLKPLARVASGGELARVALALAVLGHAGAGTVYLFDEVDQGLGGASAERIGHLLAELGGQAQVLAVTHQPVVAARARRHLAVTKGLEEGMTRSEVAPLEGESRRREVARMLSGSDGEAALNHAASLLSEGRT